MLYTIQGHQPPTYFQSFSAVIGLLPVSDAFIYSNKLAAIFYPVQYRRNRLYFDVSLTSSHTRLISAGSKSM